VSAVTVSTACGADGVYCFTDVLCQGLESTSLVNAPVSSRRELVANSVHTADTDATELGGVYWDLPDNVHYIVQRRLYYRHRQRST